MVKEDKTIFVNVSRETQSTIFPSKRVWRVNLQRISHSMSFASSHIRSRLFRNNTSLLAAPPPPLEQSGTWIQGQSTKRWSVLIAYLLQFSSIPSRSHSLCLGTHEYHLFEHITCPHRHTATFYSLTWHVTIELGERKRLLLGNNSRPPLLL